MHVINSFIFMRLTREVTRLYLSYFHYHYY